jgi:deoxyribonuclease-4
MREGAPTPQSGATGTGSCSNAQNQEARIDSLARTLNTITKHEHDIIFVLENTVHTNKSVGSDLQDFYHLKQKLEFPERIAFCIDTAHAHAYGYNIIDMQQNFIDLIDQTMGISNLALIHLNDAMHERGSHIDKHAPLGKGCIGENALKSFALHPSLSSVPLILELPILSESQEHAALKKVKYWHQ